MSEPVPELDVLVVAPHPDDAEIGVGGTILSSVAQGLRVGVLDLTNGEPTPHGSPDIRAAETAAASRILQLAWRGTAGLPNRQLQHTLDARQKLANIFRATRPNFILAPYWDDAHPDHVVASELIDAARFWSKLTRTGEEGQLPLQGEPFWPPKIYYYWSIHLRIRPQPAFIIDISDFIDRKLDALRCYESQFIRGRSTDFPTILDDIRDRARYWGWAIGTACAEPFSSREEVGLEGLNSLK